MLNQPLGNDPSHALIRLADALAALEAQCESERVGKIVQIGSNELFGGLACRGTMLVRGSQPGAVAGSHRRRRLRGRLRASRHVASDLLIMINKPFDVGDEVEVGGA
jgi:hypothetical protein